MSRVYVIAADKPLPLAEGAAFQVEALNYYRQAVELLGYPMKPNRYELSIRSGPDAAEALGGYLARRLAPGEQAQLWSVWVGDVNRRCPPRFQGRLADFDTQALKQFLDAEEICFDITI